MIHKEQFDFILSFLYHVEMEDKLNLLKAHLKAKPIIQNAEAESIGISRLDLKRWVDAGIIRRVRRGAYAFKEESMTPYEVSASIRQPNAITGLTALLHWKYTDFIPEKIWIAVPHTHVIHHPEVHTVRLTSASYKVGLIQIDTAWGKLWIHDRERAVLEGLRGRFLDKEEKFRVLKRWMEDSLKNHRNIDLYSDKIKVNKQFLELISFSWSDQ